MSHNVSGLTGGSDHGRCPFCVGCDLDKFLRLSCHAHRREERSIEVIAWQWELAVWTFAAWCTSFDHHVTLRDGDAWLRCPSCHMALPLSAEVVDGSDCVTCPKPTCTGEQIPFVIDIAATNLTNAMNAARRLAGGVRGYPMLRGLRTRLQAPVLHCTGTSAKMTVYYILACLPEEQKVAATRVILAIMSKGKKENLYLREFRELIAIAVACPSVLSPDLDPVFYLLLQLTQVVNASWRTALTDTEADVRRGAAAIMQLAASILGPLFEEVKPLDPETKDSKVVTLYMHAPIAHVRDQVADSRADVAYVSDDNIEGHIRGIGRYLYNHGGNASQAAMFADLAGLQDATLNFRTARSHPSSLIFTRVIRVCKCWRALGSTGPEDYNAVRDLAKDDDQFQLDERRGGDELIITMPLQDRAQENGERRLNSCGQPVLGKKEALRRSLRVRQRVISACFCGALTNKPRSAVMDLVPRMRAVRARAALVSASSIKQRRTNALGGSVGSNERGTDDGGSAAAVETPARSDLSGRSTASDASVRSGTLQPSSTRSSTGSTTSAHARVSSSVAKRRAIIASMPSLLPPRWLMALVFPQSTFYTTVVNDVREKDEAPPTAGARATVVREHVAVLTFFLRRTKTHTFAAWVSRSSLAWQDVIEAAETLLVRLQVIHADIRTAEQELHPSTLSF